MRYTTCDRVFTSLPKLKEVDDISSADIVTFANDAEAEIDARLAKNYTVPITDSVPLLASIATDWACYRILTRRIFIAERLKNSAWPDRFKECQDTVDGIVNGTISLVNSAGTVLTSDSVVDTAQSDATPYLPTNTELGPVADRVDLNKLQDLADERDLGQVR